jgi:poly-gamma-glutamate synthesis protein (capsule biosynthesis protein)
LATLGAGPPAGERELTMSGAPIKKGDRTAVVFDVDENDEREILEQIRNARGSTEAVIVALHSHEPANASDEPAAFIQQFARRAIDVGATLVVGDGPHRLRGIEIYKGGAILYSLGNLIYQVEGLDFRAANMYDAGADLYQAAIGAAGEAASRTTPPDDPEWWRGAVAVATVEDGRVTTLRLIPVDLGSDKSLGQKGIPRTPTNDVAAAILSRISTLSARFGTAVQIEAGVGLVRGDSPKP